MLIIPVLAGCTSEKHSWTDFAIYDKAKDIDKFTFPSGSANQVFYKVKSEYPDQAVLDFYKKTISAPWVECAESTNWDSFEDTSGNEPLFIHQILHRWVNKEKYRLLLLAIKYRSQGSVSRKQPDNNIQNVYLVEYYEPNIDEVLSTLGITCNAVKK